MSNIVIDALMNGLNAVLEYLSGHVLTCLIPAFFIAGAIGVFVNKEIILKYFGPKVKKHISYSIASVSGTILAVCSCTILPLFAGIYKKGSGIGPATAFLYAGPAINVLAIIYTANVLGYDLGIARAFFAILMSVVVGFIMATVFKDHDMKMAKMNNNQQVTQQPLDNMENKRHGGITLLLFGLLIVILIVGAAGIDLFLKLIVLSIFIIALVVLIKFYFSNDEVTDWGYETWDLTKKIFPMLIIGTFIVGVIALFLPPETFRPFLGDNSIQANLLASIIGAVLYMPTLLEVPIVGTTFGYSNGMMGEGPALALLLAGPAVSLPNMVVLYRIIGGNKTTVYIITVVIISMLVGFIYGNLIG